ncbi:MAG: DUF2062 domain-containing protein [Alphaproteobacteria bacterium]|nr:DUF2062 domain-containing protein [Alphaproteobacteria bacterium]
MFKRRTPRTRGERLREMIWPSMGLRRLTRYYKHRMGRLPGTPQYIAKGMAIGAALSFTPFVGLHMILGTFFCWLLRGSLLAMLLGTLLTGNIWTLPVIWIGTYKLGHLMLGHLHASTASAMRAGVVPEKFSMELLIHNPMRLLVPMTLSGVPLALISGAAIYYLTLQIVRRYQKIRRARIAQRHHGRHNADHPPHEKSRKPKKPLKKLPKKKKRVRASHARENLPEDTA